MVAVLWALGILLKFLGVIGVGWGWVLLWPIPVFLFLFVIGAIFGVSALAFAALIPSRYR